MYIFIYIIIFLQTIYYFRTPLLPKHFVEVLRRWKKVFGYLILPGLWGKWDRPTVSNQQCLQYKLNGIQPLMYVLFIPIVWFTFQFNFMNYAQYFQELYWVLALSASLCPHYARAVPLFLRNHNCIKAWVSLERSLKLYTKVSVRDIWK